VFKNSARYFKLKMWIQLAIYKRSRVHIARCYVIVSTICHGYNFTYLLTKALVCKRVRLLIITLLYLLLWHSIEW